MFCFPYINANAHERQYVHLFITQNHAFLTHGHDAGHGHSTSTYMNTRFYTYSYAHIHQTISNHQHVNAIFTDIPACSVYVVFGKHMQNTQGCAVISG